MVQGLYENDATPQHCYKKKLHVGYMSSLANVKHFLVRQFGPRKFSFSLVSHHWLSPRVSVHCHFIPVPPYIFPPSSAAHDMALSHFIAHLKTAAVTVNTSLYIVPIGKVEMNAYFILNRSGQLWFISHSTTFFSKKKRILSIVLINISAGFVRQKRGEDGAIFY
jgi:hypothetical protein